MVGPPHPQSATFRHTDFTEPFRHNSNLYGAISSRLQRGWGETPVTSEQCQAICNHWGIHLTGVARTLWQWNAPVSAPTTLSRLENFKLGSRLMQTAWTTWNGYDGLAASSARPVVIREDGGLGTAGSCVLDAVTAHQ